MRCTYCGSAGHTIGYCPKTAGGQANRRDLRCSYCGARDHNYEACTKHAGGGKMPGAVRITASPQLSTEEMARLQRWAADFGAKLDARPRHQWEDGGCPRCKVCGEQWTVAADEDHCGGPPLYCRRSETAP